MGIRGPSQPSALRGAELLLAPLREKNSCMHDMRTQPFVKYMVGSLSSLLARSWLPVAAARGLRHLSWHKTKPLSRGAR